MATLREQLTAANKANDLQKKEIGRLNREVNKWAKIAELRARDEKELIVTKKANEENAQAFNNAFVSLQNVTKHTKDLESKLEAASLLVTTLRETQAELISDNNYYTKEIELRKTEQFKQRIADFENTLAVINNIASNK